MERISALKYQPKMVPPLLFLALARRRDFPKPWRHLEASVDAKGQSRPRRRREGDAAPRKGVAGIEGEEGITRANNAREES